MIAIIYNYTQTQHSGSIFMRIWVLNRIDKIRFLDYMIRFLKEVECPSKNDLAEAINTPGNSLRNGFHSAVDHFFTFYLKNKNEDGHQN